MTKRILIVDDEREMRMLLSICLMTTPYIVDVATNGKEAIDKITFNQYHLVILDIIMPGSEGYELLKTIRSHTKRQVPIILMSVIGDTERTIEGLKLGADDYIVKPFDPMKLLEKITLLIDEKSRRANVDEYLLP
ncbi:response regulator [Evansella sp. AB-P1]|uniref:response regulator n=1 Tax=Evansella sp. AB-P1 TaxID=3037653 RepID=UPI00241D9D6A|nr:response regulator [Evansella sp. AB-P1]MDG5788976.1 response regulator [Evansella sp. AB-P1]